MNYSTVSLLTLLSFINLSAMNKQPTYKENLQKSCNAVAENGHFLLLGTAAYCGFQAFNSWNRRKSLQERIAHLNRNRDAAQHHIQNSNATSQDYKEKLAQNDAEALQFYWKFKHNLTHAQVAAIVQDFTNIPTYQKTITEQQRLLKIFSISSIGLSALGSLLWFKNKQTKG